MTRGKFIVVEGGDGVGKSTAMEAIKQWLMENHVDAIVTEEPGGTPMATEIRKVVLNKWDEHVHPMTELLLMMAARKQHVDLVIEPALVSGYWVLCSRFNASTYAYQSAGKGLMHNDILNIEQIVFWPKGVPEQDLIIYLDIHPSVGLNRVRERGGELDRFEAESLTFHTKVRNSFISQSKLKPDVWRIVDAAKSREEVADSIKAILSDLLKK